MPLLLSRKALPMKAALGQRMSEREVALKPPGLIFLLAIFLFIAFRDFECDAV